VEPGGIAPLPGSISGACGTNHNEPHSKAAPRGFFFWRRFAFIINNVAAHQKVQPAINFINDVRRSLSVHIRSGERERERVCV
jgi:hypothetical protein